MVTLLALLGVLGILVAAAILSTRDEPLLAEAPRDAADLALPDRPLSPEDVGRLRFSLAPRGYRMSEVDLALERLQAELADRDRRIGLLEAAASGAQKRTEVREATAADLPVTPPPAPVTAAPPVPVTPPPAPVAAPAPPAAPEPQLDVTAPPESQPAVEEPAAQPVHAPAQPVTAGRAEPAGERPDPQATPQPAPPQVASATGIPPLPPVTEADTAGAPATVPEEPAPLPPADLGSELTTGDDRQR